MKDEKAWAKRDAKDQRRKARVAKIEEGLVKTAEWMEWKEARQRANDKVAAERYFRLEEAEDADV